MKDVKYRIPRNVKKSISFLGLELLGWMYYLPISIVLGFLSLTIPKPELRFVCLLASFVLPHFACQTDERTGKLNISFLFEYIEWVFSSKKVEPVWRCENVKVRRIKVVVQEKK